MARKARSSDNQQIDINKPGAGVIEALFDSQADFSRRSSNQP